MVLSIWRFLGEPWISFWCLGGCCEEPWEALGRPWGPPGRLRKHVKFSEGVWGGSRGGPGVILVVWGGPRDRPEKWKCWYFVGFNSVFEEVRFFMFFLHFLCDLFLVDRKKNIKKRSDFGRSTCWYYVGFKMVFGNVCFFAGEFF